MCVASHIATKALYTVFLHLIAHFHISPAEGFGNHTSWDPLGGLLNKENPQAAPLATLVNFLPRNLAATKAMLSRES